MRSADRAGGTVQGGRGWCATTAGGAQEAQAHLAAVGADVQVPGLVPDGDVRTGLAVDAVPQLGDRLAGREGPRQFPTVDRRAAVVGDRDLRLEALTPVVDHVVGHRAVAAGRRLLGLALAQRGEGRGLAQRRRLADVAVDRPYRDPVVGVRGEPGEVHRGGRRVTGDRGEYRLAAALGVHQLVRGHAAAGGAPRGDRAGLGDTGDDRRAGGAGRSVRADARDRALGRARVAADAGDLAVTAVEHHVRAAVEVLRAVTAYPVGEHDVVTAAVRRESEVPVVVVETTRPAVRRRVHLGVDQFQLSPGQRRARVPALPGDVDVEPARVLRPVVVPELVGRARREVGQRPVVPGFVQGREVVRTGVAAVADPPVRDGADRAAVGGRVEVPEPVIERRRTRLVQPVLAGRVGREDLPGAVEAVDPTEVLAAAGEDGGTV